MYLKELSKNPKEKQQRNRNNKGFYESVRWTLLICRYSGLLPLSGLRQTDSQLTRYKWNILYVLIYTLSMIVQFAKIVILALEILNKKVYIERFIIFTMYLNVFIVGTCMIPFCMNWAKVLSQIESIESSLPPVDEKNIMKMRKLMILTFITGVADHMFFIAKYAISAVACSNHYSNDLAQTYFVKSLYSVFERVSFNYFTAILFELSRAQQRMIWQLIDILVINISIYLCIRFEGFNKLLQEKEKELTYSDKRDLPWAIIQQKYTKLMKLTNILEQFISPYVFFSFCNFIMIGRQFYFILNSHVILEECENYSLKAYTVFQSLYSGAHLVLRIAMVSGFASRIHTLSRKPLDALYTIPSFSYDRTFQRFIDQVYHSNISLSGFHCFYVTRQMILSMLASLLTFELMLLDIN